jgi:hypothetical protein
MNIERLLRRIRSHPALYGDSGESKERQAERIRDKCIARLRPVWTERAAKVEHERGQRLLRMYD